MAETPDTASLQITLSSEKHSASDVASLTEATDGIVSASIWATITQEHESGLDDFAYARTILNKAMHDHKVGARFFPAFGGSFQTKGADQMQIRAVQDMDNFDPFDPLDIGVTFGLNTWMRKVIQNADIELYYRLFSFGHIARLEHKSPLVIELLVCLGAVRLTPIILTYGIMRAVARFKRLELDNELRETEVQLKHEELRQRRIQTEILDELKSTVKHRIANSNINIPEGVLVAATTISSPAVAELSTNPLIGSVTLGLSTKVGGQ